MEMNNGIYLISPNYVIVNSEIGSDVEDKFVKRTILTSQDIDIQSVLGTQLYNLILDSAYAYVVSGTTIPERIETLLDTYIIPTLLYSVLKDVIPYIYFKLTPKTVSVSSGEHSVPADYDLVLLLKKEYDDKYQHYMVRTVNYLIENDTIFPEYGDTNTITGASQNMIPSSKNYNYGIAGIGN